MPAPIWPRNDVRQYDDLAGEWWRPGGAFTMLSWIARARARLIPPAARDGAVLVDLGCGAGLLAPYVAGKGYSHVGVDLVRSALEQAGTHGVAPIRADVSRLPFADGCADVVCAGELLEHVTDLPGTVAEACRILRPGGLLVLDTLNDTMLCRLLVVYLAERLPRGAPAGLHDPKLFIDPQVLTDECARHGVGLRIRGLRPFLADLLCWLAIGRSRGRMRPSRVSAVLYQGVGTFKVPTGNVRTGNGGTREGAE